MLVHVSASEVNTPLATYCLPPYRCKICARQFQSLGVEGVVDRYEGALAKATIWTE